MERAKLIVKNFGPLKDIDIEVREMVTFIGAQASGKSTLAKLLSILNDREFIERNEVTFEDELQKYNIFSFLSNDTFIDYYVLDDSQDKKNAKRGILNIKYENKKLVKNTIQSFLSNIEYIINHFKNQKDVIKSLKNKEPLNINDIINFENNQLREIEDSLTDLSISLKNILKNCFNNYSLIDDKQNICKIFNSKSQFTNFRKIFKNGLHIEENDIDKILDILEIEKKIDGYAFLLKQIILNFSNIFQINSTYIPSERSFLHLIKENALGLINNKVQIPEHILSIGQEYEKAIQSIKELPLTIIDKNFKYKREGKTSYIYHNEIEKIDLLESASGLQSIIPILILIEYTKSSKEKHNFNFVVEEPELNLYPKAQHELIKYFVKNCLVNRQNLILTTHSPFVLASINNLLLAYDKGQKNPKEVNKIIKKESWLNPKNFIAYELKNGKAKKIMNDKLGQISENMIDGVSDAFANEFDKLLDL